MLSLINNIIEREVEIGLIIRSDHWRENIYVEGTWKYIGTMNFFIKL